MSAMPAPSKRLLGLIGSGIQRSLTPSLHEEEGRHHGLRLHYQLIDLDLTGEGPQALTGLLRAAKTMGFAGLNITYPCKQAVIPLLDDLSEEAAAMGAVNTVVIRDGQCVGHNTDGSGWAAGFTRALPYADLGRVVLLGAGARARPLRMQPCDWVLKSWWCAIAKRPRGRHWSQNFSGCMPTPASSPKSRSILRCRGPQD